VIVGTAGHIDHGKTSLLQALTGQAGIAAARARAWHDHRPWLSLRRTGAGAALTGFIDVPGHEKFTHNMLAGAQGIDLVLLVVAADDGVMPQTREHLAIVELLGIPRALVAISKCDRVERAGGAGATADYRFAGARALCRDAVARRVERDRGGHRRFA
jgi:selenocysteine-specific elongation factor